MGKFVDLTGQKFGDWTVIGYTGESKWICRCVCGTEKQVLGKTLKSGASKSCGHTTNTLQDMTHQKINEWTIIGYTGNGKWLCKCSCGNTSIIHGHALRHNKTKDCGHTRYEKLSQRNSEGRIKLEGKHIGDWDVIRYVGDKHYECRCSCGRVKNVASSDLTSGISKSCGHNNSKGLIKDLTGKTFGELTAIEYLGHKRWKCKCSCGKDTIAYRGNLESGSVRSCGCKQYNRIEKEEFLRVINEYMTKYGEKPFVKDLSIILDRHEGNINRYINDYGIRQYINSEYGSKAERDLYCLFNNGILHDRTLLNGKEVDMYYPNEKIAIEFNGTYWHSTIYKDKYYHQRKTIECAKKGVQLIHIFEYEWENEAKRNKIISLLNRKLGKSNTVIYGRNTTTRVVDAKKIKEFLNKYHLQGNTHSEINIGCFHENELIGTMTFGRPRFNNNYQYELIRLAWKDSMRVIGGTEKLFKYFLSIYNPESIITYCDIAKFTGSIYTKLGFKADLKSITEPNYVWASTIGNSVLSRYQTMKDRLIKEGIGSIEQTEDEIMISIGYLKIYDSGNLRLTWSNK